MSSMRAEYSSALSVAKLNRRRIHPVLKAYGIGTISQVTPRLLAILLLAAKRRNFRDVNVLNEIVKLLKRSIEIHRFPTFCGFTVAASHLLRPVFEKVLALAYRRAPQPGQDVVATFVASAVAASGGLHLLNNRPEKSGQLGGRTIDLTLFAFVRALDVIIGELWQRGKHRRIQAGRFMKLGSFVGNWADATLFAASGGVVLWCWIYAPDKLPPSYNKQLTKISGADYRLILALRKIREGEFVYGRDTGQTDLLGSLCEDVHLPRAWGDPAQTTPIPCEVIHCGNGQSCEMNAIKNCITSVLKTGFPLYLSLNLLRFLKFRKPAPHDLLKAILGAARSASFLGAFVGLFWYCACLMRTRVGPLIFPHAKKEFLENSCVKLGCLLAGWSILIEKRQRRAELMYFVAPRALGAFLPKRYDTKYQWVETAAFGVSAGIVLACVRHNPRRVRGVFGRLLGSVLRE